MIQNFTLKKRQDTKNPVWRGDVSVSNPLELAFLALLAVGEVISRCQTGQMVIISVWLSFWQTGRTLGLLGEGRSIMKYIKFT